MRIQPETCTTMAEVRAGVDCLDRELVALLAERFRYMDAAARIKPGRNQVRDEGRKQQVIGNAMAEADRLGLDPAAVGLLWEALVEASIAHEFAQWDRLRAAAEQDVEPRTDLLAPQTFQSGASDGARTRDLRRDRPAL